MCSAEDDGCRWANDGICDAPMYCMCDYSDCAGESPPPYDGWPFTYGPAYAWNWKMVTVRTWGVRRTNLPPSLNYPALWLTRVMLDVRQESPVGTWRLEITDKVEAGTAGTLTSWSIVVYGHAATHVARTVIENHQASATCLHSQLGRYCIPTYACYQQATRPVSTA